MTRSPTILLDCRSLGPSGAGRATELLLRGLPELDPPGKWILWGPEPVASYVWPKAGFEPCTHPPRARFGQRDLLAMPRHDAALYMLQVRPLRPGPSVTLIHDTFQVHYGANAFVRMAKRAFLRRVGALSERVLTVSEFSKAAIQRDLGVPGSKIGVVRYPVDEDMVKRVHELRETLAPRPTVLFVGQFAPHKNLERLLRAFALTRFAQEGGELLLVGGHQKEQGRLRALAAGLDATILVEGITPQDRLDELYATCRALVLPSLAEGFGLPAWEAAASGLPVRVADRGALREVVLDAALRFDPVSLADIASHIDAVVDLGPEEAPVPLNEGGSLTAFAASFVDALALVLDR